MLVNRHRKLFTSLVRLSAVATAMLMVTILIVTQSEAAFSDTTDNTGNSFSTGSVTLADDDTGLALFDASTVSPGVPVVECINLTYSGSLLPADIRMYGSTSGVLAPYLDMTIDVGTGGSFGTNCAGFTGPTNLFTGTLDSFSTLHADWSTGDPVFTATTGPSTTVTLRFTVDVQDVPAAQGQTATADFTFEAQD